MLGLRLYIHESEEVRNLRVKIDQLTADNKHLKSLLSLTEMKYGAEVITNNRLVDLCRKYKVNNLELRAALGRGR